MAVAAAVLFGLQVLAAHSQLPSEKTDRVSIRFESPQLNDLSGTSLPIYEAVRSGLFDRVEVRHRWFEATDTDENELVISAFQLRAVSDFETCASAALPRHHRFGAFGSTRATQPILFQPSRFDHEFVSGVCIIAYPTEHLAAGIVLTNKSSGRLEIEDLTSPDRAKSDIKISEFWEHFETVRPYEFDLWSLDGSKRAVDKVEDVDLIRAIETGGEMQRAALNLISQRASEQFVLGADGQVIRGRTGKPERQVVRRPQTSTSAVDAILQSDALFAKSDDRRFLALRALYGAASEGHASRVAPKIIEMLQQPSATRLESAELAFRTRANAITGEKLFDVEDAKPLYENFRFLAVASQVSLALGPNAAAQLADSLQGWLHATLTEQLIVELDVVRLASFGTGRDRLVEALVEKANQQGSAPPSIQARVETLILTNNILSPELQASIRQWCARGGGMFPYGDVERAKEFCGELDNLP